jgi:hypothetical protein
MNHLEFAAKLKHGQRLTADQIHSLEQVMGQGCSSLFVQRLVAAESFGSIGGAVHLTYN